MCMHSAADWPILSKDAMPVCPAVCRVICRYCVKTVKHIIIFFNIGSHAHRDHSSFSVPNVTAIFRRGTGASNAWRGYEKIAIFDQYLPLSPKWYKIDRATVGLYYGTPTGTRICDLSNGAISNDPE